MDEWKEVRVRTWVFYSVAKRWVSKNFNREDFMNEVRGRRAGRNGYALEDEVSLGQVVAAMICLILLLSLTTRFGEISKVEQTVVAVAPSVIKVKTGIIEEKESVTSVLLKSEEVEVLDESRLVMYYTENDVIICAKLLTKEAGGVASITEKSGVIWVVLNRVASSRYPDTIEGVITEPYQFEGWHQETEPYDECLELARDVLDRWNLEMNGFTDVGRTLPEDYLFFTGDGDHNWFAKEQNGVPYVWGSQLVSPYKN